jgi:acetyltransferase-like isoleucine patch superfamily enzyme
VGNNVIIGTSTVVTRPLPANAVAGGIPARILRMREEPETLRWDAPGAGSGGPSTPAF